MLATYRTNHAAAKHAHPQLNSNCSTDWMNGATALGVKHEAETDARTFDAETWRTHSSTALSLATDVEGHDDFLGCLQVGMGHQFHAGLMHACSSGL